MRHLSEVFSLLNARLLQHIIIKCLQSFFENDSFDNVYSSNHPVFSTEFQGFSSF